MVKKLQRAKACLLILSAMTSCATAAKSESLCDGLNKALGSAEEKFVPLRGNYDWDMTEYAANVSFGPADECVTDSKDGVSELHCTKYYDDLEAAHAGFLSFKQGILQCFGRGITSTRSTLPYHQWFHHEETTDDIEVRVGVVEHRKHGLPPKHYVTISVNYIDPRSR